MEKLLAKKRVILTAAAAVAAVVVIGLAAVLFLRVDSGQAQNIALERAGGGEIVREEVDREGLLNEYSYTVVNGDSWYEIELNGFGRVTEMESRMGEMRKD